MESQTSVAESGAVADAGAATGASTAMQMLSQQRQ